LEGIPLKVDIHGLRKVYEGGVVGLHRVDLAITNGIFALLGPNGAGKSTLMSILATLLDPTEGDARVDGHDVRREKSAVRRILGYLPQDFGLYPSLTAYETLDYMGLLCGLGNAADRRRRIDQVMEQVNLTEVRNRPAGALSGGMRQRVGLAQALLNSPGLLIVDEPTAGLDPEERIRVRSLLAELSGDRVILLSTHLIEDVQAVADRVAVLHRGLIRFSGAVDEMMGRVGDKVWEIEVAPADLASLRGRYLETSLSRYGDAIRIRMVSDTMELSAARRCPPTLEDAYIWLMQEEPVAAA